MRRAKALDDFGQPRAWDEEKAGNQHRNGKSEHAEAEARDLADDRAGRLQQGRSEPLHRGFKIAGGEAPGGMDPFADHGPIPHRLGRPRHGHRPVPEVSDQVQRGFGEVDRDSPERGDNDHKAQQRDQGRRQPTATTEKLPQCCKGRIERHGEDDGPDDHDAKGREQRE